MFFTAIHQMMTESVDLTIVIRKTNGQLTVSTLPKSNGLKDEAQNHIVPLTVTGTPQELDTGFLQAVTRPIQKACGLISNMAQFEAQADKAAASSKAAKEAKSKETKEEREKREKYEKLMKKAEELTAARNHREAVSVLTQAKAHANAAQLKEIEEKIKACLDDSPLSEKELEEVQTVRNQLGTNFCRRCNYCAPCSVGIDISGVFLFAGYLNRYGLGDWARNRYSSLAVKASACIECGKCETRCPYHLPIREMLKECAQQFGE